MLSLKLFSLSVQLGCPPNSGGFAFSSTVIYDNLLGMVLGVLPGITMASGSSARGIEQPTYNKKCEAFEKAGSWKERSCPIINSRCCGFGDSPILSNTLSTLLSFLHKAADNTTHYKPFDIRTNYKAKQSKSNLQVKCFNLFKKRGML